jgi:tetratricopeptide (TPR) repeat protein
MDDYNEWGGYRSFEAFVDTYEQALQEGDTPSLSEDTFSRLLDYYDELGHYNRIAAVASHAIEQYRFNLEFYLRKAQSLLLLGQYAEALDILDEAELVSPADITVVLLRAESLAAADRYEEALKALIPFWSSADPQELSEIYLVESLIHEYQQDYDKMFETLKQSLEQNPFNTDALERVMLAVELSGKHAESIGLLKFIIDENPYSHHAWHQLGHSYETLSQWEEALEAYEYTFLIKPDELNAYLDYADLCADQEQFETACESYEIALKLDPDNASILTSIGLCHQSLNKLDLARSYYYAALAISPDDADANFHLGECYAATLEWPKARIYYQKAVELDPYELSFINTLADLTFYMGLYEEAELYYLRILEIDPLASLHWLQLAWFYFSTDRAVDALTLLTQTIDNLLDDAELLYAQACCFFETNKRKTGIQTLEQALAKDYTVHPLLFDWMPELADDQEVTHIIALYRPPEAGSLN